MRCSRHGYLVSWIVTVTDQLARETGILRNADLEDLVIITYLGLLDDPDPQRLTRDDSSLRAEPESSPGCGSKELIRPATRTQTNAVACHGAKGSVGRP